MGTSITKDETTNDYTIRDANGDTLAWYRGDVVEGWSRENEPFDMKNLSAKNIERLAAEIAKYGIEKPEDDAG